MNETEEDETKGWEEDMISGGDRTVSTAFQCVKAMIASIDLILQVSIIEWLFERRVRVSANDVQRRAKGE